MNRTEFMDVVDAITVKAYLELAQQIEPNSGTWVNAVGAARSLQHKRTWCDYRWGEKRREGVREAERARHAREEIERRKKDEVEAMENLESVERMKE